MTGRLPVCEQSGIAERLAEIQAERMASIAGCQCPPDGSGGQTHRPGCALEPRPAAMPSQLEMAREAIRRARARQRRTADDFMAEGIAAKAARHRVLS